MSRRTMRSTERVNDKVPTGYGDVRVGQRSRWRPT
jgi:hypothetical protein